MNAITKEAFGCAICGTVFMDKAIAEGCCVCSYCKLPVEENKGRERTKSHAHNSCINSWRAQQRLKQFEKAEKDNEYAGPVFDGDNFYEDVESYVEHMYDSTDPGRDDHLWPEYVFCCTVSRFPIMDINNIIANLEENHGQFLEDFDGIDISKEVMAQLKAAAAKFNEETSGYTSWDPDYKRVTKVPRPGTGDPEFKDIVGDL